MAKIYGLAKNNRLKSRKQINDLFISGKTFTLFPLRVLYKFTAAPQSTILKTGVTVSKKNFKRAVDRNRIKRLLRESYRVQKNSLLSSLQVNQKSGFIFFVYSDKVICTFNELHQTMGKSLNLLEKAILNESNP
ncbi:MAG: ribonuclease P protein component [Flavisolibacter sp.]